MNNDPSFSHFIITRFNIRNKGWDIDKNNNEVNNEDWLHHRIALFDKFCFPSMLNQAQKDFTWLVFFDPDSPEFLVEKISDWATACDNFRAVFVDDYEAFLENGISDAIEKYRDKEKKFIITTRIDNDDSFHKMAVEIIRSRFIPSHNTIIDLENGYTFSTGTNLLYKLKSRSNAFVSLIEDKTVSNRIASVMKEGHPAWRGQATFCSYKGRPMWLQVIHEKNVSNSARGRIQLKKSVLQNFGIEIEKNNYFLHALKYKIIANVMLIKHFIKVGCLPVWRLLPFDLRENLAEKRTKHVDGKRMKRLVQGITGYYQNNPSERDNEKTEILNYIRTHKNFIFPYEFADDYYNMSVDAMFDKSSGLPYVDFDGKKLFFPSTWSEEKIKGYFRRILLEQDERSPHKYLSGDFQVTSSDIVVDIGAADGNFSLSVADTASKIYIIEPEESWAKPLQQTFSPWKEKVTIINKSVSDHDDDKNISIDNYFRDIEVSLIKIDVEGAENKIIKGASQKIGSMRHLKIALSVYHKQDDAALFKKHFEDNGFKVDPSKGYIIYLPDNEQRPPFLRKGVLRITNKY